MEVGSAERVFNCLGEVPERRKSFNLVLGAGKALWDEYASSGWPAMRILSPASWVKHEREVKHCSFCYVLDSA